VARIILLDGGTGMELLHRSADKAPRHWSAEFLISAPDLVQQVHLDYIRAGARVVTINAYSASFTRMAMVGAEDRVPWLQRRACELASAARDAAGAAGAGVAIAGCLPPLNGTYRPDRVRDFEANCEEYRRIAALQAPHVDLFLCETMSTAAEAQAAASAAAAFGKPVWVGWTLADHRPRLRSGERIAAAQESLAALGVSAVLANCCAPEAISMAMTELVATGLPAGGYANGFTRIPESFLPGRTLGQLSARRDLGPGAYAAFALKWVADGATLVGGCCEVGPAHIAALRDALLEAGHEIVGPPGMA
jgi:S-methylmethionine-dependent homocysteine/selenocysteine methylase